MKIYLLPLLLSVSCIDNLKELLSEAEAEDTARNEGDRDGDCIDGTDNDNDGSIDCNDSGCANKPLCAEDSDLDSGVFPEDTGTPIDTGTSSDTQSDTDATDANASLRPDYLLYTFMAAYERGGISNTTIAGNSVGGYFTAILYDSATTDQCAIDWVFNSSSVVADPQLDAGTVTAFGASVSSWFGFIITSPPTTRGNCSALSTMGQEYYDALLADEPGFGFGPLTSVLESSMQTQHPSGWNSISDLVFTGIASSIALAEDGDRDYYAINEAYAYPLENGITSWDPNISSYPQGTELLRADIPTDAFYVSSYYQILQLE